MLLNSDQALEARCNAHDGSRIDCGQAPVRLDPVDVAAVRAAVGQTDRRGCEVRIDIPSGTPPVQADADRLEDVLANLIGNACKFSPIDTPVRVTAQVVGQAVEISVEDQGSGIPPEEQDRIFDRFYQVQRGSARQVGGSGLGLYIVRGYVTAMGGEVRVRSTPGEGSTFRVSLPLATATPTSQHEHEYVRTGP